jgi:hypothetical protein
MACRFPARGNSPVRSSGAPKLIFSHQPCLRHCRNAAGVMSRYPNAK